MTAYSVSSAVQGVDPAANLARLKSEISATADKAGRDRVNDPVTIVAVSKKHDPTRIMPALAAGHRVYGENRVQEALGKWAELRHTYPDLVLHLIGPLQSNKAREAAAFFDVIETIDRPKIARAIADAIQKQGRAPSLLIQVNTGEEPQKAGIAPGEATDFIRLCRDELALPIRGLMCIPPIDAVTPPHFALLAAIAKDHDLPILSMGMSNDYKTAVSLGATHVRIGTAVFGERPGSLPA